MGDQEVLTSGIMADDRIAATKAVSVLQDESGAWAEVNDEFR